MFPKGWDDRSEARPARGTRRGRHTRERVRRLARARSAAAARGSRAAYARVRRRRPGQAAPEAGARARRAAGAGLQPGRPTAATCSGSGQELRLAAHAQGATRRLRRARQRRRPRPPMPRGCMRAPRLARARSCTSRPSSSSSASWPAWWSAADGAIVEYPVVETARTRTLHICREVLAPADVSADGRHPGARTSPGAPSRRSTAWAPSASRCSCSPTARCVINELAPRPHNSGHYTIDACWTSQFDNHVRAVLGLPLGETGLRAPAAVMVNLLGTLSEPHQCRTCARRAVHVRPPLREDRQSARAQNGPRDGGRRTRLRKPVIGRLAAASRVRV